MSETEEQTFERLRLNSQYDIERFWSASFTNGAGSRENLRARITMDCHFLEHGLALPQATLGHGLDRARRLLRDLDDLITNYGPDPVVDIALGAFEFWVGKHTEAGWDMAQEFAVPLARLAAQVKRRSELGGGVLSVSRKEIQQKGMMDFVTFAESRFSVRNYTTEPVAESSILRAVRAARKSPSSCNRQTCRARIFTHREDISRILKHHVGNNGFGHLLGGLAIITSHLGNWGDAHERNSGLVDGAMFAMSFLYGLHAEGLGALPLNWSTEHERDKQLRALVRIPDDELVVILIGFGHMPETFSVPQSQRRPLEMTYELNEPLAAPAKQERL